jgi:glycogen operon protein
MRDLVSFNHKHNDANGEHNRDGESHNRSWNCGAEGATEDSAVIGLRARQQRNFLATLLLSHGVPMLLSGDELGRTQGGNNNAYCQDNAISWLDWQHTDQSLLRFVTALIALRASEPLFSGTPSSGNAPASVLRWFSPEGHELNEHSDGHRAGQAIALLLESTETSSAPGHQTAGGSKGYLLLFNPGPHAARFELATVMQDPWQVLIDTAELDAHGMSEHDILGPIEVRPHSLKVLRRVQVRVGVIRSLLPA